MDFGRELSLEEPGGPFSAPRMEDREQPPMCQGRVGGALQEEATERGFS